MLNQFFPRLSQNYIEILEDGEHCDIIIEVGENSNLKRFQAHMIILCYRSPFLRQKKNNDIIKLPNISPDIFEIILKYIYGGIISFNEQKLSEILKLLLAADQLLLQELIDYLQDYLIENKFEWIKQNFEYINRISFQSNNFLKIQKFCTDFMIKSSEKIFKSRELISLPEKSLISLLEKDDLKMKEIDIWDHVLKWGLAKNTYLIPDPKIWTDDDFKIMKITLKNCLPLIRFFSLSSDEFIQKVHPYKNLLNHQLYEDLLNSYLNPNSEPNDNILLPRYNNINDIIIDSKIVNLNIISLISRWIDKKDIKSKFIYIRELYLPYDFKLLLRGSHDGFTPKKFHELCDNIPRTITFFKLKGTEEIIGGYNPLKWKSRDGGDWGRTKDSFIFSFKSNNNFKNHILSYIKDINRALYYDYNFGPAFGNDIDIYTYVKGYDDSKDYNFIRCKQESYEKKIRNTEEYFSIENYEVFQIIKKEVK